MDAWGVWLVAIGVIVAGASAAFAWVQAHSAVESLKDARKARDAAQESAKDSARLAGEANAAFIRQAEAQEEANRIKREEMTPNDWSGPAHVSGDLYRMSNTSRGVLFVESFDVKPDEAANLVSIRTNHQDGRYEYGDSFELMVMRVMGPTAEKLTIRYRRQDDSEGTHRTLHIGL